MALGIISGTGLYNLTLSNKSVPHQVKTPYGAVDLFKTLTPKGPVYFLPRHGLNHSIPPHLINYRANICALALLGVKDVLAFCSVGGMNKDLPVGSLILLEQFIDQTWGREVTFAEIGAMGHVEMSRPYCPQLSGKVGKAAAKTGINLLGGGVYLCTQGPRFETPAEIKAYQKWGANIVGMTGVPEAPLARESGLCYASVGVVANYAAGLVEQIDVAEITAATNLQQAVLAKLLDSFMADYTAEEGQCQCSSAKIAPCFNWTKEA